MRKKMIGNLEESNSISMVKSHRDLGIYQIAFEAAMKIFGLSKNFPVEEVTAEVDQMKLNAPIPKIKSIT